MKVLITNTVAVNGGDAAILLSIIRLLRGEFGEDVEFIVFDNQPEIASRLYPGIKFKQLLYLFLNGRRAWIPVRIVTGAWNRLRFTLSLWCWKRGRCWVSRVLLTETQWNYLQEYVSADFIVSTGGTYLTDRYSLKPRVYDYAMARLARRPTVFFTQSMGPFPNRFGIRALRRALDEAVIVLVRDERSRQHLLDLQSHVRHVHVSSDAAFALADEETLEQARLGRISGDGKLRVALSVRQWRYFKGASARAGMERFEQAMSFLTEHLVKKHGAEIVYVSTCQGVPEYAYDDSIVADRIAARLSDEVRKRVRVDHRFHSPLDLLELLRPFDIVVATRMHMAILSLIVGVPVLPIAYEFKTSELFNRLGLGNWVESMEGIDGRTLAAKADAFLEAIPTLRDSIFQAVQRERSRAIESARLVRAALARIPTENA